jgi:serine-type D-Ala-D-Ala carboxypeptidase (penicillin-binding protein 5/6)
MRGGCAAIVRRAARVRTAAFFHASANPWNLPAPDLPARTYLLIETQSGTELAAHNADMRLPPASLTKLMTACVLSGDLRACG